MDEETRRVGLEIIRTAREMLQSGLVEGTEGNVSAKVGDDRVLITPTSMSYMEMALEDLVLLDLNGNVLEGKRQPSSEKPMHLKVYNAREDVRAIIHTHSLYASVLAVLRKPLPPLTDEFMFKYGGTIEVAEYGLTGSEELAENAVKALGNRAAVMLANHGVLCCGKSLAHVLELAKVLERMAKIYVTALMIGEPHQLPEKVIRDGATVYEIIRKMK
ncbi:MAG: class II aldolase/adducin family protein [Candidatus Jordarchaeales archaeon]|nr:class II aldolase/adducin family protein [Candidatus Jordarchaeia archaeon]